MVAGLSLSPRPVVRTSTLISPVIAAAQPRASASTLGWRETSFQTSWVGPALASGTLRRVAQAAQNRAVADVDGRTASGERHDVIDGQVGGAMGVAHVARAPVAALAAPAVPAAEHAGAGAPPGSRAVEGVVPTTVGLAGVLGAAAIRAARDDTDRPCTASPADRRRAGWHGLFACGATPRGSGRSPKERAPSAERWPTIGGAHGQSDVRTLDSR